VMQTAALRFLHLLATVTWIGGMIVINLVLMPSLAAIDSPQRGKLLGAALEGFKPLALGSMVVLLITGLLRTQSGALLNLSTTYGAILAFKHLTVLAMIVIGLAVPFVISPRLAALAPAPGERSTPAFLQKQRQLSLLATVNMVLGAVVLLLVAAL
jgi:uncharacterized membrane protein